MITVDPWPAPCRVMFLLIVSLLVHVAVPEGTTTVSPAVADITAVPTSAREALLAVIVLPCTCPWAISRLAITGATMRRANQMRGDLNTKYVKFMSS